MKNKIFTTLFAVIIALIYFVTFYAFSNSPAEENPETVGSEFLTSESIIEENNNPEMLSGLAGLNLYSKGQSIIYEVPENGDYKLTNYGFSYSYIMPGTFDSDSGRTVLHPVPGRNTSGYLCRDIYENLQHSDEFDSLYTDEVMWYLKPVMRIAKDLPNETPVCRIEIVSYNGEIAREIELNSDNFKDFNGNYEGEYKEKYMGLYRNLEIFGGRDEYGLNKGVDKKSEKRKLNCKVDFRIYWYGQAELWFDKMVVEDPIASEIFSFEMQACIKSRIKMESKYFNINGEINNFLKEKITVSRLPCIGFLLAEMNLPAADLRQCLLTNDIMRYGLCKSEYSRRLYTDLLNTVILQSAGEK